MHLTNSQLVASAFKKSHQSVMKVIESHKTEFEEVGPLELIVTKNNRGKPGRKYAMNEKHVATYAFIAGNNPEIRKFKKKFVSELSRMKQEVAS